ncbi:Endoplasmic reticulum chaperone BiP [Linnemannia gamsii]|uniref:Endoplasmic reticulum chaperone BiP n=1 Tax=Linnemannia gamsii TaxID=64522 RepID=A0ABQ7KBJ5_9FUNG|nr:Endoplasmic reticulum chaperone BiP [Linnemannia gamsii]
MSRFKRPPHRSTTMTWTAAFLFILLFTLTIFASLTTANIEPKEQKLDISTITSNITGLVLADPKRKVVDHPVDCPFYLPFDNDPPFTHILAIDLGISYTSAGYYKDDKFHYVLDNNGHILIPSYVSIINNPDDINTTQILFGEDAKAQLATNPQNTLFNWQRLIRLPYGHPTVQSEINSSRILYKIVSSVPTPSDSPSDSCLNSNHVLKPTPASGTEEDGNKHFLGLAMIQLPTHTSNQRRLYKPEDITALLISNLKQRAEVQAGPGTAFTHAVTTIPSDYTDDQRHALEQAIEAAGLTRLRFIRRHLAPSLAYRVEELQYEDCNVVMVNLDPEYLEVAVAEIDDHVYDTLQIVERKDARYDDEMANRPVVEYLVDKHLSRTRGAAGALLEQNQQQYIFGQQDHNSEKVLIYRHTLLNDTKSMKRLYNEILKVNTLISNIQSPPVASNNLVRIEIDSFYDKYDFSEELTVSQWQALRQKTLTAIVPTVERVLKALPEYHTAIDVVVVAGTSPLVPDTIRLLKEYFKDKGEVKILAGIDPALSMVQGMAAVVDAFVPPSYITSPKCL